MSKLKLLGSILDRFETSKTDMICPECKSNKISIREDGIRAECLDCKHIGELSKFKYTGSDKDFSNDKNSSLSK